MPKKKPEPAGNAKLSITMTADAAEEVRALAVQTGLSLAQLVRQSLALQRLAASLSADEQLCIKNTKTGELTRVLVVGDR